MPDERMYLETAVWHLDDLAELYPDLDGRCGDCQREVTNEDPDHRVTPILKGGRGVECKLRGDYE